MKKIKIDVGMCTGCGQCALTCAFRNTGVFDLSQSNIKVLQWEDICLSVTLVCQQCQDAPCISACPSEAIGFSPDTGAILIDLDLCTQCQNCVEECRYEVIQVTPAGDPMTCDLCGGDPKCVLACYPQALSFEEVPDEEWEPFKPYAKVLVDRANGRLVSPPNELADEGIKPRRPA
jgi:carbon-monoxide dehydrogenase iron sulfur subunit